MYQLEKRSCTYSELHGRHKPGRGLCSLPSSLPPLCSLLPCLMPTCVPICRRALPVVLFMCQGESSPSAPLILPVCIWLCPPPQPRVNQAHRLHSQVCIWLCPPLESILLAFLGGTSDDQMSKSHLLYYSLWKRMEPDCVLAGPSRAVLASALKMNHS